MLELNPIISMYLAMIIMVLLLSIMATVIILMLVGLTAMIIMLIVMTGATGKIWYFGLICRIIKVDPCAFHCSPPFFFLGRATVNVMIHGFIGP